MAIQVPTVNINGTEREVLIAQQMAVLNALHATLGAMMSAYPNGRDYPDGGLDAAMQQHTDRRKRVEALMSEVGELAEAI